MLGYQYIHVTKAVWPLFSTIGSSSSLMTQKQLPRQQDSPRQQQSQKSSQQQAKVQQSQMQQNEDDEWLYMSDNDESFPPAALTTAYILYDFDAKCPEELSVSANEVVTVIEDSGNGWLRVYRGTDTGYIPSAYVQFT